MPGRSQQSAWLVWQALVFAAASTWHRVMGWSNGGRQYEMGPAAGGASHFPVTFKMFGRYGEPHRQSQPEEMAEASEKIREVMTWMTRHNTRRALLGTLIHYEAMQTSLPRLVSLHTHRHIHTDCRLCFTWGLCIADVSESLPLFAPILWLFCSVEAPHVRYVKRCHLCGRAASSNESSLGVEQCRTLSMTRWPQPDCLRCAHYVWSRPISACHFSSKPVFGWGASHDGSKSWLLSHECRSRSRINQSRPSVGPRLVSPGPWMRKSFWNWDLVCLLPGWSYSSLGNVTGGNHFGQLPFWLTGL